jgi:hypothetical protein
MGLAKEGSWVDWLMSHEWLHAMVLRWFLVT